jgi:hypothetical protein
LDLGRDLTCGCLSSLEGRVEAAGVVGRDLTSFVGAAAAVAAAEALVRGLSGRPLLLVGQGLLLPGI